MSVLKKFAATLVITTCFSFSAIYPTAGQATKTRQQLDIAAARADRKALVGDNLTLNKARAEAFWPLYDAYEGKMDKLDDRHAAEVRTYAQHYQTFDDNDASKKLDEVIAIRQERLDVQKEFVPKFRAAIGSISTTRFYQIDNKLNAMLQCEIARALPLVSRGAKVTHE
jgi:hypothetical protein